MGMAPATAQLNTIIGRAPKMETGGQGGVTAVKKENLSWKSSAVKAEPSFESSGSAGLARRSRTSGKSELFCSSKPPSAAAKRAGSGGLGSQGCGQPTRCANTITKKRVAAESLRTPVVATTPNISPLMLVLRECGTGPGTTRRALAGSRAAPIRRTRAVHNATPRSRSSRGSANRQRSTTRRTRRQPSRRAKSSTRRTRSVGRVSSSQTPTGFSRPLQLAPPLAALVGASRMPRHQITKAIWAYVKQHDLAAGTGGLSRGVINCDERLAAIFGCEKISFTSLQRHISVLVTNVTEPAAAASPTEVSAAKTPGSLDDVRSTATDSVAPSLSNVSAAKTRGSLDDVLSTARTLRSSFQGSVEPSALSRAGGAASTTVSDNCTTWTVAKAPVDYTSKRRPRTAWVLSSEADFAPGLPSGRADGSAHSTVLAPANKFSTRSKTLRDVATTTPLATFAAAGGGCLPVKVKTEVQSAPDTTLFSATAGASDDAASLFSAVSPGTSHTTESLARGGIAEPLRTSFAINSIIVSGRLLQIQRRSAELELVGSIDWPPQFKDCADFTALSSSFSSLEFFVTIFEGVKSCADKPCWSPRQLLRFYPQLDLQNAALLQRRIIFRGSVNASQLEPCAMYCFGVNVSQYGATEVALPSSPPISESAQFKLDGVVLMQRSDVAKWSPDEVLTFARSLKLMMFAEKCEEFNISGRELLHIQHEDLVALGISAMFVVNRVLRSVRALQQDDNSANSLHPSVNV